jgi:hypothetical protein
MMNGIVAEPVLKSREDIQEKLVEMAAKQCGVSADLCTAVFNCTGTVVEGVLADTPDGEMIVTLPGGTMFRAGLEFKYTKKEVAKPYVDQCRAHNKANNYDVTYLLLCSSIRSEGMSVKDAAASCHYQIYPVYRDKTWEVNFDKHSLLLKSLGEICFATRFEELRSKAKNLSLKTLLDAQEQCSDMNSFGEYTYYLQRPCQLVLLV